MKTCSSCNKERVIWKNHERKRYCQACWFKLNKPTAIPKRSEKRKKEEKEYSQKRLAFLKQFPVCQLNMQGCLTHSTDIHHSSGRSGDNYLNEKTWIACCRNCHDKGHLMSQEEARSINFKS